MTFAEVVLPVSGIYGCLTYKIPTIIAQANCKQKLIGCRVRVKLKNRPVVGVIINIIQDKSIDNLINLKDIELILDEKPIITKEQIELCKFVSSYYMSPIGKVIRLCLPPGALKIPYVKKPQRQEKKIHPFNEIKKRNLLQLNLEQENIIKNINSNFSNLNAFLIEGITGSGKTEIYIRISETVLKKRKKVLIIIPEIALSSHIYDRFVSQIDQPITMLHSKLSPNKRREIFYDLLENKISLIIGTRSALFAPISNLGLIIVDEEHDSSLKQDETPRYNARDIAIWRAKNENAIILLGSATPSLESIANVKLGKLNYLKLTKRAVPNSFLPVIELIDLKSKKYLLLQKNIDRNIQLISYPLRIAIKEALERNEQILLFLNRRGYASLITCTNCGKLANCPNCSVSLTFHSNTKKSCCHLCNYTNFIQTHCLFCGNESVKYFGFGLERIQKEILSLFPGVNSICLDSGTMANLSNVKKIFAQIDSGMAQILIGTQIIAKGYDFPNLSLVGIILADMGLSVPDFRASEKTFQLLMQVSGRAGRRDTPGRVLIQTMNPENLIFSCIKNYDLDQFYQNELNNRKIMKQPPYVKSALIRIESKNLLLTRENSIKIKKILELNLTKESTLLGPAPALIEKLKNIYRWQIFLKTSTNKLRNEILKPLLSLTLKNTKIIIDIDPIQIV